MLLLNPLPQRLDIGATPTFAGLLAGDGTAAAPSISFANSTNMGFFRSSANVTALSIGGVAQFFWGNYAMQGAGAGSYISLPTTGAISLVAAGTNQNITLTPSGTGVVQIGDGTSPGTVITRTSVSGSGVAVLSLIRIGNEDLQLRNSGGNLSFWRDTAEFARFNISNRFLLGTTTDSGALLQVGANAAAGYATAGMSFGGDTFLYREANGVFSFTSLTAGLCHLKLYDNTTLRGSLESSGSDLFLSARSGQLIFRTNGATTALTLDASQNSVFAGSVRAGNFTTAGAPPYAKGVIYFDTTLNKLRVGGATAFETITSV